MQYYAESSDTLISEPAIEPVTVEDLVRHCRIPHSAEDAYLKTLITTARQTHENVLNKAMISQQRTFVLPRWPVRFFHVPRFPVLQIDSIEYKDVNGDLQTYDAANYVLDSLTKPARIERKRSATWPTLWNETQTNRVFVTYTAGFGVTALSVPMIDRQTIAVFAAYLWANRGQNMDDDALPEAYNALQIGAMDVW